MAAVGGVHKLAVIRNLNICAGVFAAIKSRWQRAGRVEGLKLAGRAVERIRRDAVALFIIAIHNGQLWMKGEMAWFQALGRPGCKRIVPGKLARLGIKPKLIHRVRAGVRHKGKPVGGIGQDGVCAPGRFDQAQGILDHRAIPADGMAAHYTATVAGPKQRAARTIGGHVGGIGADFRDTQGHERFLAVINAKRRHAVGRAHRDIQRVAIRAHTLRSGRSGEIVFGALHEGARLRI